jgi:hypothetical protein
MISSASGSAPVSAVESGELIALRKRREPSRRRTHFAGDFLATDAIDALRIAASAIRSQ